MDGLIRDLRLALRGLRRRPGFAAVVALTLGLGIGATTAVFTVVDAVLVRPLPYPVPQELAVVVAELPATGRHRVPVAGPELVALWEGARSLELTGAVWARPGVLRGGDGPAQEVEIGFVTPGFFEALRVSPRLGRLPTREELTSEQPDVIVLSDALWQSRYGSDPEIVGRKIDFDDERRTVVGVMPPDFRMLFPPDEGVPERLTAWIPWGGNAYREMARSFRVFTTVTRLRSGYTVEQAAQEIASIAERVRADSVDYQSSGFGLRLVPLAASVAAHVRPTLVVLSGVVLFVLLIAGANAANLMLARAADAERDLSVRAAIGASRSQLLRQLLAESALLGLLAAAVGVTLAGWGLEMVRVLDPGRLPRIQEAGLDGRALAVAGAAALVSALVSGLLVALRTVATVGTASLHNGVRTGGGPPPLLRRGLVVSQLALSLTLLVGAGLLVQSVARLMAVDPGFDPRGLLTLRLSLPDIHYDYRSQGPKIASFYRRLDEAVARLPGVQDVGATMNPPLSGLPGAQRAYAWRAAGGETDWGATMARYTTVTPGWFRAARVRLLSGRFLDPHDGPDRRPAVVVDAALARRAWPDRDAVGQEIRVLLFKDGRFTPTWGDVVGVVETVRHARLEAADGEQVYLAHLQAPQRTMHLTLRTAGDPKALVPAVQAEVEALEKDLPLFDVHLAVEHVARAAALPRFALSTLGAFAGVAVLLAVAGVYAVMSFSVARRRHEIGVRLALGAAPRAILALVLREAGVLVGLGVAAGLAGAFVLSRYISGLLFGVGARDPATFATVAALLAATAVLACALPARRASRVDPTEALRAE